MITVFRIILIILLSVSIILRVIKILKKKVGCQMNKFEKLLIILLRLDLALTVVSIVLKFI